MIVVMVMGVTLTMIMFDQFPFWDGGLEIRPVVGTKLKFGIRQGANRGQV